MSIVKGASETGIFDFQWPKSVAGYELREPENQRSAQRSTSQLLLESGTRIVRLGAELSTYPPRAFQDLHRRFAALGDAPGGVLEFVRSYGFLGMGSTQPRDIEWESVSEILTARDHMRDALAAFDGLISLEREAKLTAKAWGEDANGAQVYGFRQLAGRLFNEWAAPRLVLRLRSTENGLALYTEPQTLLGSMWLQVAEELTGGAKFRHCEWCRKPIPIGEGGGRRDKKTCSDACRQALSTDSRKQRAAAKLKTTKKSKQGKKGTK